MVVWYTFPCNVRSCIFIEVQKELFLLREFRECRANFYIYHSIVLGITSYYDSQGNVRDFFKMRMSVLSVLVGVGMTPSLPKLMQAGPPEVLSVVLDGRVVGSIPSDIADKAVSHFRRLKLSATSGVCFA